MPFIYEFFGTARKVKGIIGVKRYSHFLWVLREIWTIQKNSLHWESLTSSHLLESGSICFFYFIISVAFAVSYFSSRDVLCQVQKVPFYSWFAKTLYHKLMLDFISFSPFTREYHVSFLICSMNVVKYISQFQMLNQSWISGISPRSNLVVICCIFIYCSFSLLIFCLGYLYLCSRVK